MDMNSPIGKRILALVRNGDYAHAGEEEAIEITFQGVPKNRNNRLLDVGCGRGGTAHYVQSHGWGRVLGIDLDAESIAYARETYPGTEFLAANAISLSEKLSRQFDIIYLFNVLYALADHLQVLEQLRKLSCQSGRLVVFDYSLKAKKRGDFPFPEWNPVDLSALPGLFSGSDWRLTRADDISHLYKDWYENLVTRIQAKKEKIETLAGGEWFDFVLSYYWKILSSLEQDLLGGVVIHAVSR
jgi:SAM-dependent methyltransferase